MRHIVAALGIISIGLFALFTMERAPSSAQPAPRQVAVVENAPAIPVVAESSIQSLAANAASEPEIVATANGFTLSGVRPVLQSPGTWMHNLASPVIPEFPKSFAAPVRVRCGMADVSATPADARDSAGHIETDGSLLYCDAFDGCDVRYRCDALKTEEFIVVHQAPAQSKMEWSWELKTGGLTPHLTHAFTIELSDAAGVPRLRINAPDGKDAAGKRLRVNRELTLALQGSRLTLAADLSGCKFPVTIDPSWTNTTGSMVNTRGMHTATLLTAGPNAGKVLVVGGYDNQFNSLNLCEFYDPATGTWSAANPMATTRYNHTASLLNNNKVLITGGVDSTGHDVSSCELFDETTLAWTTSPSSLSQITSGHTATTLTNGKVLIAGGVTTVSLAVCELYDPVAGTWSNTGSMAHARYLHSATLLPPGGPNAGKVLVAGGQLVGGSYYNSCELYDPVAGTWSATGSMITARGYQTATLLTGPNGKVLVAGGYNVASTWLYSSELYDPVAGTWSATGSLTASRNFHTATLLANGKVLVAGGNSSNQTLKSCELYDPAAGTWSAMPSLLTARQSFTATVLSNNQVLATGGYGVQAGTYLNQSEIFDAKPVPQPLTVTVGSNSSGPITLQSVGIDPTSVTYSIVTPPSNGVLSTSIPGSPNYTYTPNPGFLGLDSFTYQATDNFGTSPTAAPVNITVNIGTPVITSLSPDATTLGTGISITVTGSNFFSGAVVRIGSTGCTTTFVSSTQLIATIPASALTTPGQIPITVSNPGPGAISQSANLFVYSGAMVGTWIVTNTLDDVNPGSLRFAMSFCRKGDSILFDPTVFNLANADLATVINVLTPLPLLDKASVTIDAQNQRVTVNGSGAGSTSGFIVTSDGNKIFGLNILAFTGSGISISGGKNNTIGGDRTLGTGVNGQGVRIARCGAAGIELTNGACNNIILGCWIGLDSSGSISEPNLGGILIHNQSCTNAVGGGTSGQANVISGNEYEGITISDTGTNNNVIQGNIIGAAAVTISSRDAAGVRSIGLLSFGTRTGLGNGGAGIFLSQGTQGSVVGAAAGDPDSVLPARSNVLAFNGGNGIEIRATVSKQNSSRGNLISNNIRGGIALFDGSNSGINPPLMSGFTLGTRTGAGGTVQIQGTATNGDGSPGNGMIEIFSDPGNQGQNLLVRTPVTNGTWSAQATLSDLTMNVNATYTDANGNTSSFGNFGTPPIGASSPFLAVLDQLAGIDPSNPATAPVSTGTVMTDKFAVGLNFAKSTGHDSLQTTVHFMLPPNFTFGGTTAVVAVDEVGLKAALDSKGKATSNGATLKLLKPKSGSTGVLLLSIRNQSLATNLADAGLTNQTTAKSGVSVNIPIGVALVTNAGTYLYQGSVTANYKATMGKSGKAKK
jgi:hypothetical protein